MGNSIFQCQNIKQENFARYNISYCMFDFEIKGTSEGINQIVHDESLPAKPDWQHLIYRTGLSHTKLCIGKWERRGPVR